MDRFGMNVKFTAKAGQRDALVQILLGAATAMEAIPECEKYMISVSDSEPDTIWVNEIWNDAGAHKASLDQEATKASIQQAMPLIAGVEAFQIRPVGGKGL
ncbi:quinol monooxygenase YgiN [Fontibacillus phaseoli]|uniref:Quinol monooxygenase YgiN n=1 Tax=Fontibacillus phaseoli TaxID=1416533 RepID=A0A369BJI8_9BACL|nr:antibiotic biosynthesis monooxygenase [Fontibacillus phaseoli]RCX21759.1 quinol monooxygenase YgiN [Fontibacillus phaseoli]